MKTPLQAGFSLSACGHAQAGGWVSVRPEKRFFINRRVGKKIVWFCIGVLLAVVPVRARAYSVTPHAGVRLSFAHADIRGISNDNTLGAGFLVGFGTPDYRLTLDLMRHGYSKAETRLCVASYDRLLPVGHRASLFAGVHGGVADFEPGAPDFRNKSYVSGWAGGAQAGVVLRLGRNVLIETGVRHSQFSIRTFRRPRMDNSRLRQQTEAFLALMYSG